MSETKAEPLLGKDEARSQGYHVKGALLNQRALLHLDERKWMEGLTNPNNS